MLIDQNHRATLNFMHLDIYVHIPPQDTKGYQKSHQMNLKVRDTIFMFYPKEGPQGKDLYPLPTP